VDYNIIISREDRSYSILIIITIITKQNILYLPYRAFKPLLTPRQLYNIYIYIYILITSVWSNIILETLLRMFNNYYHYV